MEPSPSSNPIASTPIAPAVSPDKDAVLIERWVRTCDQLAKPVTAVIRGTTVVIPDFGVELIFNRDGKYERKSSSATSGAGLFPADKVVVVRIPLAAPTKPIGGTMYDVVAHKLGFQRASDVAADALVLVLGPGR